MLVYQSGSIFSRSIQSHQFSDLSMFQGMDNPTQLCDEIVQQFLVGLEEQSEHNSRMNHSFEQGYRELGVDESLN
jgi:hypothetical protein